MAVDTSAIATNCESVGLVGDVLGRVLMIGVMIRWLMPEWGLSPPLLVPEALFVLGLLVVVFGHTDFTD